MSDLHGGSPGDLYIKVMVQVPISVTPEQRKLLEEYARISGETIKSESFGEKVKKVFK